METNILVIEDSETIRREIVQVLNAHSLSTYCHEAGDGLEGLKVMLGIKIDLVLCDVEMPRLDGFRFLSMVRCREELRDIPVILLTGMDDSASKIAGLEQGANDYITKPFDDGELVARVRVHLKMKRLQDQLRRANELLVEVSNTDHLTGLYNRRYLMDVLEREFSRARRNGCSLSLLVIDMDHFKEINDTCGHQAGDLVLAEAASVFREQLRNYDTAVRFGGDEFVAVLPGAALPEATAVAERVRKAVEACRLPGNMAHIRLSFSIGIAVHPADGVETVADFIREADSALYRAKEKGRNRIEGPLPRIRESA